MQRIGRRSASRQDLMPTMLIVQFTFILTQETNGECIIWGRKAKFVQVELLSKSSTYLIQVEYKTHDGKKKKSKLLTSGFWGLARHLNYVFELLLALSWRYLLIFSCTKLTLFSAFPHLAMASFPLPTSGSS